MPLTNRLLSLWRNLSHRRSVDRDLDDELRGTFDLLVDEHVNAGMRAEQARRAAMLQLGGIESVKAQVRDVRTGARLEGVWHDIRFGARFLLRSPLFAATALVSLAVGIGANTAIFTLVDVLMLRDANVAAPEQLIELDRITRYGRGGSFSYPIYQRMRDENAVFSGTIAMSRRTVPANIDNSVQPVGRFVSGNFFGVLGVSAVVGRVLSPDDDRLDAPEGPAQAVISHRWWLREFGGRPDVLGRTVSADSVPFTIVGVLPDDFDGLVVGRPADFYMPLASEPYLRRPSWLAKPDNNWLAIVGRLKPGVTAATALVDLQTVFGRFTADFAATLKDPAARQDFRLQRLEVESARRGLSDLRRRLSSPVLLLMGAVSLVLLIACANVINLLLARGVARRREIALRLAIGASRSRLIRQLVTESLLLGLAGGGLGLILAWWGTPLLVILASQGDAPLTLDVRPDGRILLFTAAIALLSSAMAGTLPALRSARADITPAFQTSSRTTTAGRGSLRWTQALIAAQVALSLVLLVGATLLTATLRNIKGFDPGFDREHVLLLSVNPTKTGFAGDRLRQYFRDVLTQVRSLPGVTAASLSVITPISGGGMDLPMVVEGRPASTRAMVYANWTTEDFFATFGTRVLRGRDFRPDDTTVAVVNDALVRRYFPSGDAIGQRVSVGSGEPIEIVGVVASAKYMSLREQDVPTLYGYVLGGGSLGGLELAVRTAGDPQTVAPTIQRVVAAVAPAARISEARTLAAQVDRSLAIERLVARLLSAFSVLALLLASIGLYGVLGYSVARRTSEIGVRLALGASRGVVLRSVLTQSWMLVGIGCVIGVIASRFVTRFVGSLLYDVTASDPRVMLFGVFCLFIVGLSAAVVPAWRASRVDPLIALRQE